MGTEHQRSTDEAQDDCQAEWRPGNLDDRRHWPHREPVAVAHRDLVNELDDRSEPEQRCGAPHPEDDAPDVPLRAAEDERRKGDPTHGEYRASQRDGAPHNADEPSKRRLYGIRLQERVQVIRGCGRLPWAGACRSGRVAPRCPGGGEAEAPFDGVRIGCGHGPSDTGRPGGEGRLERQNPCQAIR